MELKKTSQKMTRIFLNKKMQKKIAQISCMFMFLVQVDK